MRANAVTVFAAAVSVSASACVAHAEDPDDPSDFRAAAVERAPPPAAARADTVRVACDDEGNLHVRAPDGVRVTTPLDAREDAEAEIAVGAAPPPPAEAHWIPVYGYVAAWGRYAHRDHRPTVTLGGSSAER